MVLTIKMMMCGTSEDLLNVAYPNMATRRKQSIYINQYEEEEEKINRQGASE